MVIIFQCNIVVANVSLEMKALILDCSMDIKVGEQMNESHRCPIVIIQQVDERGTNCQLWLLPPANINTLDLVKGSRTENQGSLFMVSFVLVFHLKKGSGDAKILDVTGEKRV